RRRRRRGVRPGYLLPAAGRAYDGASAEAPRGASVGGAPALAVSARVRPARRVALPDRLRQRQVLEECRVQRLTGRCARFLQEPVDLTEMLEGMPGGALEQLVRRLETVVGLDAPADRILGLEPGPQRSADRLAVARDGGPVRQPGGRHLPEPRRRQPTLEHRITDAEAHAEEVVTELMKRAIAPRVAEREMLRRHVGDEAARRRQDEVETLGKGSRGETLLALIANTDELGHGPRVPAVHDGVPEDDRRNRRDAEPRELGLRAGLGGDVDGVERHSP